MNKKSIAPTPIKRIPTNSNFTSPSIKKTKDVIGLNNNRVPLTIIDASTAPRTPLQLKSSSQFSMSTTPIKGSMNIKTIEQLLNPKVFEKPKENETPGWWETNASNPPPIPPISNTNNPQSARRSNFMFVEELKASLEGNTSSKETMDNTQSASELEKKFRFEVKQLQNQISKLTNQLINSEEEVKQYREEYEKIKASGKQLAQSYLYKSERLQYLESQLETKQKISMLSPQVKYILKNEF